MFLWKFWYESVYIIVCCLMKFCFYKFARSSQVYLLGGINNTQLRTNRPLRINDCCQGQVVTNHGPVCDMLVWRTWPLKVRQKGIRKISSHYKWCLQFQEKSVHVQVICCPFIIAKREGEICVCISNYYNHFNHVLHPWNSNIMTQINS